MLTVRRVPLKFPADLDPIIVPGCPEELFVDIGLSLLLPYMEPYLVRSMRAAKQSITDKVCSQTWRPSTVRKGSTTGSTCVSTRPSA